MSRAAAEYRDQLLALLPPGAAWPRDPESIMARVLAAAADGLARIDGRGDDLLAEADPRATLEMLGDWERVAGLPDDCAVGISTTLQERRAALTERLTSVGGQSRAYMLSIAAALGYDDVTLTEYRPFVAGLDRCGDRLNGGHEVRHVWRINVLRGRVTYFRAGVAQAGDRLGDIDIAEDLECRLRQVAPVHTTLVVSYGDQDWVAPGASYHIQFSPQVRAYWERVVSYGGLDWAAPGASYHIQFSPQVRAYREILP